MKVFQVLHIPTGEYLVSKNRGGQSVLFADEASAQKMIANIVMHAPYVQGAPLTDYKLGPLEATQAFCLEEFDCIASTTTLRYPAPRILSFS